MKQKVPEILAPAGTYEALEAAVKAGCDAVYAGGSFFSARAYAGNFDEEEYLRAIDYCHLHGVKIHMTLNTLLKEEEIQRVPSYVEPYYKAGLDAVLVQDMGVFRILKENFPDLPLHCSTQMSIASAYGAQLAKDLGFSRVVPARELSLDEVRSIREKVDIEIETFVHGAMCFAYSGKCLFSSFAGGRSGNRGRCAQPCRQCYELLDTVKNLHGILTSSGEETKRSGLDVHEYIMSLKDLCTIEQLPFLIDAGIDSFKIEGRMKNPSYVALAVSSYRKARDLYLNLRDDLRREKEKPQLCFADFSPEERERYYTRIHVMMDDLRDIYNRGGFSSGYYFIGKGRSMAALKRPNHIGLKVGTVAQVKAPQVAIRLTKDLHRQDVLELIKTAENGNRAPEEAGIELTSNQDGEAGELIWLNGKNLKQISPGMDVYRTRSAQLISRIEQEIIGQEKTVTADCRIEAMVGKPLCIRLILQNDPDRQNTFSEQNISVEIRGSMVEPAQNAPTTADVLISKMKKSGGSGVQIRDVECDMDENAFIRMSDFNTLRREAVKQLKRTITEQYRRKEK